MNLSILHISDLHREPSNPIGNQPLLDSLENDRRRYTTEEQARVKSPDVIIISGDIIHGVRPDATDVDNDLRQQYAEALKFLNELTARFLGREKRRVVVVPGNHDVSAPHFYKSLQRINLAPGRKKQLFSRDSALRWSWSDFELYEITNRDLYAQRLAAFSEFYKEFYEGARTFTLDTSSQFDIFDFPEFNATIVGFCSCYNNDLLNKQGDIHPDCIARASMKLREPYYQDRLRIAVWHHSTAGLPLQSDYMNPDILQNLIDRGFSVGFHGHHHRPQFLDTRFRHEGDRHITVVSAGTLCGGAAFRFGRAYNVIELDIERRTGLLHLREMQNDNLQLPIWGRRCLPPGSRSYLEFSFDPPPEPIARTEARTTLLIEAQKLYDRRDYINAAKMLASLAHSDDLARRLLLDCFGQSNDMAGVVAYFDPPTSVTEAIYLLEALWRENRHDRLRQILDEPIIATSSDPAIVETRAKYLLRLQK